MDDAGDDAGARIAGDLDPGEHVFALRVYYEDTDAGGVVYYASYLRYAERARTEMLRDLGFAHAAMAAETGAAFAVRRCTIEYLRPARLDDLLAVHTRLVDVGGATVDAEQVVCRDGAPLARLDVRLAHMTTGGRPRRLPEALRESLETFRAAGERA